MFGKRRLRAPKLRREESLLREARGLTHELGSSTLRQQFFVFGWTRYVLSKDVLNDPDCLYKGMVTDKIPFFIYSVTKGQSTT